MVNESFNVSKAAYHWKAGRLSFQMVCPKFFYILSISEKLQMQSFQSVNQNTHDCKNGPETSRANSRLVKAKGVFLGEALCPPMKEEG